jgi:hypothetical protein
VDQGDQVERLGEHVEAAAPEPAQVEHVGDHAAQAGEHLSARSASL